MPGMILGIEIQSRSSPSTINSIRANRLNCNIICRCVHFLQMHRKPVRNFCNIWQINRHHPRSGVTKPKGIRFIGADGVCPIGYTSPSGPNGGNIRSSFVQKIVIPQHPRTMAYNYCKSNRSRSHRGYKHLNRGFRGFYPLNNGVLFGQTFPFVSWGGFGSNICRTITIREYFQIICGV